MLASGDYSAASDIKARYATELLATADPVTPTSTGDGYRLAFEVGATMVNGDIVRGPIIRFVPAPRGNIIQRLPPVGPLTAAIVWAMNHLPQWILRPFLMTFVTTVLGPSRDVFKQGAILVNRLGQRFTDERAAPDRDLVSQPDRLAFIVFDANFGHDKVGEQARPNRVIRAPGGDRGDNGRRQGDLRPHHLHGEREGKKHDDISLRQQRGKNAPNPARRQEDATPA